MESPLHSLCLRSRRRRDSIEEQSIGMGILCFCGSCPFLIRVSFLGPLETIPTQLPMLTASKCHHQKQIQSVSGEFVSCGGQEDTIQIKTQLGYAS